MNEKNIILLAALGLGAFFLFTSKTAAAAGVSAPRRTYMPPSAGAMTEARQPSSKDALIAGGIGLLGQWLTSRPTAQQIATEQASEIAYYGAAPDGQAVNVAQNYAENYYSFRGDN